ncbi:Uncharacterized protein APZ42_016967 [Daphnia magna]|uniref:Uncharacterized protein n=1 Tax=Daphnia magna TaxID=35525 RepID=A0A165A9T6_9CRUS|nr:Uncharacterized protein APZ42_016967 [Daphnia magna]
MVAAPKECKLLSTDGSRSFFEGKYQNTLKKSLFKKNGVFRMWGLSWTCSSSSRSVFFFSFLFILFLFSQIA